MNVRNKIQQWAESTYGEMLESRVCNHRYRPGPEIEMARRVLQNQGLTDKTMCGTSTNDLLKTEREVGKFKYVSVFNAIARASDWCPMDMVYGTCFLAMRDPAVKEKADQWHMSEEELITKMCGRALRALPSYLREHDLRQQLSERIPEATFVQNESLDTVLHADIMMERDGETYYFWSFVNTPQSIANFQDKFFGRRQGHIPDGIHVTCPFSMDCCDEREGWKLHDPLAVNAIVRMLDRQPVADYSQVEELSSKTNLYFQTPKLIAKEDEVERQNEIGDYALIR